MSYVSWFIIYRRKTKSENTDSRSRHVVLHCITNRLNES